MYNVLRTTPGKTRLKLHYYINYYININIIKHRIGTSTKYQRSRGGGGDDDPVSSRWLLRQLNLCLLPPPWRNLAYLRVLSVLLLDRHRSLDHTIPAFQPNP